MDCLHLKIYFWCLTFRYDVPEISKYLDYMNIMTYDFHGQWEKSVGHNSPLLPLEVSDSYNKKLTVVCIPLYLILLLFLYEWTSLICICKIIIEIESWSFIHSLNLFQDFAVREWVRQGAPRQKIMAGIPTYGRSFELASEDQFDIGAPAVKGGTAGRYTQEEGFLSYYEVKLFLWC